MSTSQVNLQAQPHWTESVSGKLAASIGALVAVTVAVLFLVLGTTGASRHLPQTRINVSYPPMIQYHGTGATPIIHRLTVPRGKAAAPRGVSIPGDTRTEHSYGAVP